MIELQRHIRRNDIIVKLLLYGFCKNIFLSFIKALIVILKHQQQQQPIADGPISQEKPG